MTILFSDTCASMTYNRQWWMCSLPVCIIFTLFFVTGCQNQPGRQHELSSAIVGGGCDGCELMYTGMPGGINAVDTSAGWTEAGQKLQISGAIYQPDGKTPAEGVILYYWQTDHNGYYTPNALTPEAAKRHGHIRGWVKTGADGRFSIYTIRPAPYPNDSMPAHIHVAVKEPGIATEYYIDEWVFDDDPLLNEAARKSMENRGGSGILQVASQNGILTAEARITLGYNIPHHPGNYNKR